MGNKKTLWIRELSCGHDRPTNISFIFENYEKPNVGVIAENVVKMLK